MLFPSLSSHQTNFSSAGCDPEEGQSVPASSPVRGAMGSNSSRRISCSC